MCDLDVNCGCAMWCSWHMSSRNDYRFTFIAYTVVLRWFGVCAVIVFRASLGAWKGIGHGANGLCE